jgi:hypothetical protein
MNREWVQTAEPRSCPDPSGNGSLIVLGICDIVWLWKATHWQTF